VAAGVLLGYLAATGAVSNWAQAQDNPIAKTGPKEKAVPPGSPAATTTIPGNQLPAPPPKFGGIIKENATDSKPWWPPRIVPPKGAPNVLLIMTDDQGY